jgi:hypothetical protein
MWIFFSTEFGNRPQENWNEDAVGEIDMQIASAYVHRQESSRLQHICKSPSE